MGYDKISMPASIAAGEGGFMELSAKEENMLREIINTSDYEGRTFARKMNCEGLLDQSRQNMIMMRVKTYLRSLTVSDILVFLGKVTSFVEELLNIESDTLCTLKNIADEDVKEREDG